MRNRKSRFVKAGAIGAVLLTLAACGRPAPNLDEITLIYDKGPTQTTGFQECVEPGKTGWAGPNDLTYTYTAGQITYDFTGEPGSESAPLRFISDDDQEMEVTGVLTIELNTDCKTLQEFNDNIGRRKNMYNADDNVVGEGWVSGLQTYVGQPLLRALQDGGQQFGWSPLRNDGAIRGDLEKKVQEALPGLIAGATEGGNYFVNPKITINKPKPTNPELLKQVDQKAAADARLATIASEKEAQNQEIGQIQQLVQAFGGDWAGYIAYRSQIACEQGKAGCIPYLPLPAGGAVAVPTP